MMSGRKIVNGYKMAGLNFNNVVLPFKKFFSMFLVKREYFNKIYIIKGLITALFFSAFIYLTHFGIESKILNNYSKTLFFQLKRAEELKKFTGRREA